MNRRAPALACFILLCWLAPIAIADADYSMWVEPNFVDTEYSALLQSRIVTRADDSDEIYRQIPFGWIPYYVKAEVRDVYKGNLRQNETIELLVYLTALSSGSQLELISAEFLLSFCRSSKGTYFTSRDYLVQRPTPANIAKFAQIRDQGTRYEGSGDCSGNYPALDPDNHD